MSQFVALRIFFRITVFMCKEGGEAFVFVYALLFGGCFA